MKPDDYRILLSGLLMAAVLAISGTASSAASGADLEKTMMGAVTFDEQIKAGEARLEGRREPYNLLKTALVQFSMAFEILPGTSSNNLPSAKDPFAQEPPAVQAITD